MKFSQKIFAASFALMLLSMYILGGFMITYNHKANVEREMSRSIGENMVLRSAVTEVLHEYSQQQGSSPQNSLKNSLTESAAENVQQELSSIIHRISDTTKDLAVQVNQNGKIFCSNADQPLYEPAPLANPTDKIGAVIREETPQTVLNTYSKIQVADVIYAVYTQRDITALYKARNQQIKAFINISVVMTLFCALVLAVMIYVVTRKIRRLQEEAEKVCQGDYSAKIAIGGKDEIADLGRQFNAMIDSVNRNMSHIRQVAENRKLFISDLTHEIKSPLTSIIGYAELLKNVKLTDEDRIRNYAEKIHEDGKYIEQLSGSLTQLVLLGEKPARQEMVDVSELLKKTMVMAQNRLAVYGIPFEAAIFPHVKQMADPSLIQSVILNLLKNACKASPADSKIKVLLDEEKLSVSDQGKGIPLEELERIREPFYQLDNQARNRQEHRGLGLGLPLCIKIAETHGWQLIIQSKVGAGTTVTIFFNKEGIV